MTTAQVMALTMAITLVGFPCSGGVPLAVVGFPLQRWGSPAEVRFPLQRWGPPAVVGFPLQVEEQEAGNAWGERRIQHILVDGKEGPGEQGCGCPRSPVWLQRAVARVGPSEPHPENWVLPTPGRARTWVLPPGAAGQCPRADTAPSSSLAAPTGRPASGAWVLLQLRSPRGLCPGHRALAARSAWGLMSDRLHTLRSYYFCI